MNSYRVVWEIDIEANSAKEAARIARNIQLNNASIATVFYVYENSGEREDVDLLRDENEAKT